MLRFRVRALPNPLKAAVAPLVMGDSMSSAIPCVRRLVEALAATASTPPEGIRGDSGRGGIVVDMAELMAASLADAPVGPTVCYVSEALRDWRYRHFWQAPQSPAEPLVQEDRRGYKSGPNLAGGYHEPWLVPPTWHDRCLAMFLVGCVTE